MRDRTFNNFNSVCTLLKKKDNHFPYFSPIKQFLKPIKKPSDGRSNLVWIGRWKHTNMLWGLLWEKSP